MRPAVTIGICVRNCEDCVKDAIGSVLEQDFPHELMELILVNDGSEDRTLAIIQECVSRIDVPAKVFNTPWRGIGHARNIVTANAEGNFILWVDGDMVLSKDFVRRQVKFMQQNPQVGIAKGKQALEFGGNLLATLEGFSRAAGRMIDYRLEKASRAKALGTGGAVYRAEALLKTGGFDENLRGYCEDWDIEIKIRSAGWSLCTTSVEFLDYERNKLTWKTLWSKYWFRGYCTHYFHHKNRGFIKHYRMFPPAAFLSGFLHAHKLFKMTRHKVVFLLPFQYLFKMTAWYIGFIKGHLNYYEPRFS